MTSSLTLIMTYNNPKPKNKYTKTLASVYATRGNFLMIFEVFVQTNAVINWKAATHAANRKLPRLMGLEFAINPLASPFGQTINISATTHAQMVL